VLHFLWQNRLAGRGDVRLWRSSGMSQKADRARPGTPGFSPTGPAVGGCRAGSVTEGRPGLEWYLFTSTIRIRPNFNLTVKIVFSPDPTMFLLGSPLSKRTIRIWYISPHPTATNRGAKRTVPSKKFQKSPVAKVGPISLTYLFGGIKIDRYGRVQFLIRRIEIREGKYFFKEN
jgi:hypothetical protein